jgi:nicotinamidase-related amidase
MKPALIIIDVQRGLFDASPHPADADAVIARINKLSWNARNADIPVIFVQHEKSGSTLQFGSTGWELEQHLHVESTDHKIRKTTPDSFQDTKLGELLSKLKVSRVIVCGYATEFCVDTTIRRAASLGYEVIIAADAHTTHDKSHMSGDKIRQHHNATLPEITSFGPKIRAVKSEEIDFIA